MNGQKRECFGRGSRNRFSIFICLLLFCILGGNFVNGYSFNSVTLDNGLTVYVVEDPASTLISAKVYVRAGSMTEGAFLGTGISHYLEHLLSGGTTQAHAEKEYMAKLALMGGANNAYTTSDHTCYYVNSTPQHTQDVIQMLYEWMFEPAFTSKEVKREQQVIIKEIEKNKANLARQFYQMAQGNQYRHSTARYPVIGYLDSFKTITKADLEQYHQDMYTPSNMVLVLGGNIRLSDISSQIEATFGQVPASAPPLIEYQEEPAPFSQRVQYQTGPSMTTRYSVRFSTVSLTHEDLYALDLLDFILGNGENSILHQSLVEEKKLAYSVSCTSHTPSLTNGYFEISAELDFDKIGAFEESLIQIITEIKKGKMTVSQIRSAKKQKIAEDLLSVSTVEDKVSRLGLGVIYAHSPTLFDVYSQNFKQLEKSDLVQVAKRYLVFDRKVVTVLSPEDNQSDKSVDQTDRPKVAVKKKVLSNGVRVLLYPDSSLPKAQIQLMMLGGIRAENKEINGIGALLSDLMGKASKQYKKKEILSQIEGQGAHLYGSLGRNTLYFTLQSVSDDFESLLPIFFDTSLHPVFSSQEMAESKRQIRQGIIQRPDDWYRISKYHFNKKFFKSHSYGLPMAGELDSLNKINAQSLQDYYASLLVPSQMTISVVGAFDEDKMMTQIQDAYGSMDRLPQPFPSMPLSRTLHSKASETITPIKQDVAAIMIGFDTTSFKQVTENIKLDLLDAVLSGMNYPGGRLHQLLRGKGYVYMVHATNLPGMEEGAFFVYALSSKDKIEEVKSLILGQIEDVQKKVISDKEYEEAMAQLSFYHQDRLNSNESLALVSATDELYGVGFDHHLNIPKLIQQLTKKDVQKMAKKYLQNPQVYLFYPND